MKLLAFMVTHIFYDNDNFNYGTNFNTDATKQKELEICAKLDRTSETVNQVQGK